MRKGRRNAIGDLIILLKSQIIWDSRGQNPIVSTKEVGDPCYDYVLEEHASIFSGHTMNLGPIEEAS